MGHSYFLFVRSTFSLGAGSEDSAARQTFSAGHRYSVCPAGNLAKQHQSHYWKSASYVQFNAWVPQGRRASKITTTAGRQQVTPNWCFSKAFDSTRFVDALQLRTVFCNSGHRNREQVCQFKKRIKSGTTENGLTGTTRRSTFYRTW